MCKRFPAASICTAKPRFADRRSQGLTSSCVLEYLTLFYTLHNTIFLVAAREHRMIGSHISHSFDSYSKSSNPQRVTVQPATVVKLMLPYCSLSGMSAAYRFQMHAYEVVSAMASASTACRSLKVAPSTMSTIANPRLVTMRYSSARQFLASVALTSNADTIGTEKCLST